LELAAQPSKVVRAPDITLFYPEASLGELAESQEDWLAVVPNIRMLDQGKETWGNRYEHFLRSVVRGVLDIGLRVRILVHGATGQDLALARRVSQPFHRSAVTLVDEDDPIALKRLIGQSRLLLGSRYHSLVAAFSSQVPAIALGWSHKYDMLFRDFGCEKYVLSSETSAETALDLIRELLDPDIRAAHRDKVARNLQEMYAVNQEMWKSVEGVLTSGGIQP
jgi:colanic acid/amylovoran biosynthesis protein